MYNRTAGLRAGCGLVACQGNEVNSRPPVDIARILLIIVILSLLIFGSLYIVRPFLPALIWATMIVVATWPLMIRIEKRIGGRRWIAVTVMLAGLLVVIVLPLYGAVSTIAEHGGDIVDQAEALPDYTLPPPPRWLHEVPLAGERSAREWQRLSDAGRGGILAQVQPYAIVAAKWLLSQAGAVGVLAIHLVLTVVIAGILYAQGEAGALSVVRFATRIAAERGAAAVRLSALAIRAVALGIVMTAAVQAALGGLGLYVAGVPGAGVLTAVILILCLAQVGPALPLIGAAVWLFYHDQHITAIALGVWTLLIMMLDKVLRPLLIKRGVDLSLLLILTGVIGGVIAFGIVGLFIGPVILAVTFTLLQAWTDEGAPSAAIEPTLTSTDQPAGDPQQHHQRAAHGPRG
ncbi:membrane protein [Caballeronia terrestris]|uniref:Membrane protein n=1 Tax=Caballeronia terrestris TaxID=1226301 RepID=A0A158KZ00_9BURK|nr:AI-2E family transporter YdiK [Caballeronia terrestris]SAL86337.1 membrane protein [Caballeronia terrestris]